VQAAETRKLKGTWGTDEGVKEYLSEAFAMSGKQVDVLRMPGDMKVRRVPGSVPHLEFGEPWTFDA
jgi:hypothetical protein